MSASHRNPQKTLLNLACYEITIFFLLHLSCVSFFPSLGIPTNVRFIFMLSPWPNSSLSTYIPQFPMLVSLMCTQYAFRSCQEFRVMFLTISVFLSPPFRPSCWREGRSLIFRNFSIFHVACVQKPETVRISSFTSHMFADFTASVRSLLLALFAPILFNCFRPIPVYDFCSLQA